MHDPPFWQDIRAEEYARWWRPEDTLQPAPRYEIPTGSWFHHVQYGYASGSSERRLKRKDIASSQPLGNVTKTNAKKRKRKIDGKKEKEGEQEKKKRTVAFGSKKIVPPNHVLRTFTMRIYPTASQKGVLKTWFAATRHTYNWALGVLKKHHQRGLRMISPSNRMALKTQFVTCHTDRVPRRLRWLKDIPYSIREESTKELSMAYAAAFKRWTDGMSSHFDDIKFRSVRSRAPQAITIPTQNFSKVEGQRWRFYVKSLPDGGDVRFFKRDIERVLNRFPEGPARAVKITMTTILHACAPLCGEATHRRGKRRASGQP